MPETAPDGPAPFSDHDIAALLRSGGDVPRGTTANQSQVHVFADHDPPLVIKTPRPGLAYAASRWAIRREYRIYQRLAGVPGIPHCHGLYAGAWLVLAYQPGWKIRFPYVRTPDAATPHPAVVGLRRTIAGMHARGVAHADLKRHDNIILTPEHEAVVIDFGTALLRDPDRRGGPLWRWAAQQDWNAWARYGWGKDPARMPPAVARLQRRTVIERVAKGLRQLGRLGR
ncbi:hypothetical protein [Halorhodospira halophila]|uniref:hypothetical protein n=1 Tax=Halorhodospira halophila TaxID=1053 RepID=UPI001912A901|nr:hypothetical protein [Halorhodospira halophila]MBK5935289.1 hypothetical protein [Halorhodospira halophila]